MTSLTDSIRRAKGPTILPGNLYMPGGASIVLSTINMQRSPTWWGKDVDEFKPSRWYETKGVPQAYRPFNAGPRTVSSGSTKAGIDADIGSAPGRRWQ
jgi:cytochrome P450